MGNCWTFVNYVRQQKTAGPLPFFQTPVAGLTLKFNFNVDLIIRLCARAVIVYLAFSKLHTISAVAPVIFTWAVNGVICATITSIIHLLL